MVRRRAVESDRFPADDSYGWPEPGASYTPDGYSDCGAWPTQPEPATRRYPPGAWPDMPEATRVLRTEPRRLRSERQRPERQRPERQRPERQEPGRLRPQRQRARISRRVKWGAAIVVVGLIFRKAIAFAVLTGLSAALHLVGLNVHLPHLRLAWPWQSITAGTTTDTPVGPWVLQKIEGISKPALGTENFSFTFTHKVSKNIGIWPCWYSSTFDTVGRASATVDLNPGPGWWAPATGHYRLQVLSRPATGQPGRISVAIVLPRPQLPQSVHDITVDDTLSHPVGTPQHSWTYPGLGCGGLIRPQFSPSVLYAQAQSIAFYQATHNPSITAPLIRAAETEAAQIIRDNFIQPTANALGYTLAGFTLRWAGTT
jgi:hypothetical protein